MPVTLFQKFDHEFPMESETSKQNGNIPVDDTDVQPNGANGISTYYEEKIPIPESEQVSLQSPTTSVVLSLL